LKRQSRDEEGEDKVDMWERVRDLEHEKELSRVRLEFLEREVERQRREKDDLIIEKENSRNNFLIQLDELEQ
jgi:hypothetical protein